MEPSADSRGRLHLSSKTNMAATLLTARDAAKKLSFTELEADILSHECVGAAPLELKKKSEQKVSPSSPSSRGGDEPLLIERSDHLGCRFTSTSLVLALSFHGHRADDFN